MIRDFEESDLTKIELNEFSEKKVLLDSLKQAVSLYQSHVIDRNGIRAILFYRNYAEANYEGFLLCSKYMTAFDGRTMKNLINDIKNRLGIKRIETLSQDCEVLNNWHLFLGFLCEGVKRKFLNNQDYRMWAIVEEG